MKKLKELWLDLTYERTKGEAIWLISSFIAAILALVMLFFAPTVTVGQCIIVAIFSLLTIVVFCIHFFNEYWIAYDYVPDDIISSGWCIFATMLIWMFPISVHWALIPLGIMFFLLCNTGEMRKTWVSPIFWVGIFSFWFIQMQNNIDAKNYLKSDPKSEVVVLSNFDDRQHVFFIEGQEEYLRFEGFGSWDDARELDLKKGDTVKIVRHPNRSNWVIKISK